MTDTINFFIKIHIDRYSNQKAYYNGNMNSKFEVIDRAKNKIINNNLFSSFNTVHN
jgi:hypothetical protein